ncbi:MAG: hypothetical protein KGH67_03855 [Candidatus Micrarchaeota archaeon]|nr:hypothetical protein [Candidatus Micrarchaeota archaeon]
MGVNFSQIGSPEMYFGYQEIEYEGRVNYFGNSQGLSPNHVVNYTLPNVSQINTIYLSGKWYNAPDSMISEGNQSDIILVYKAEKVNVVASGNGTNTSLIIKLDGHNINQSYLGSDARIVNGSAVVNVGTPGLYNIVSGPSYGVHEVEIVAKPNFRIYTFTFG